MVRVIRQALGGLARRVGLARPSGEPKGREEAAGYYDRMYASTDAYQVHYARSHYYFLWSVIVDRVRTARLRRVLEIGCGPGQLAAYLLDQGVESYTGADFSATAIEMARRNAPRGTFLVGDARDPALHSQAEHDAVICTEVLEHVADDLLVVSHFRAGKRCFCTVPNFPYESHVRHFRDAAEVAARYGPFFDGADIMTFHSPLDANDRFFLIDGVRNTHTAGGQQ
jgi:SAM-dependent methyltransferase